MTHCGLGVISSQGKSIWLWRGSVPLSRWALQWWPAVVRWLGYPYFRSKQWSTLFWLCLTQFWLKVKCGQERPDTWKQKKIRRQRGGWCYTRRPPPPPPPWVETHGSVTACIYCKLFIERNASKVWVFLTINEWVLVLFPVCWMVLTATQDTNGAPFLHSLKSSFLLPVTQGPFESSFLS